MASANLIGPWAFDELSRAAICNAIALSQASSQLATFVAFVSLTYVGNLNVGLFRDFEIQKRVKFE